ncbi:MAG TPA: amidohydrolase family protein [bacterium]|nr:amidohydrolase family protein [bacterium]
MKKFNKPGIYRKVLMDTCKIKTCLNQCGRTDLDRDIFTPVMPLIGGLEIVRDQVTGAPIFFEPALEIKKNREIKNLDDYVSAILYYISKVQKEGAVGLKMKSLPYSEPDRKKAAAEFSKIRQGKNYSPMIFDSYVIDMALSFAEKQDMTVAVHTGYWGDFRKLHPLHIIPLLQRFPAIRFDIYHLGYPWVRDTLMLAKGFSNVWLNFCWTYIISEKCAADALDEAIDTVPSNRIIGFGGDYNKPVEEVYGHLVMARESMAKVLGRRIREETMSEKQALTLLKKWFWDNPVELYRLKL